MYVAEVKNVKLNISNRNLYVLRYAIGPTQMNDKCMYT